MIRFLTSKEKCHPDPQKVHPAECKTVGSIAALGVSPFIMQSTESLVMITLNSGLQKYGGDLYVGTMSIMSSIMQLIVIPVQGVSQGVQPIMSYNYGAGKLDSVRGAFAGWLSDMSGCHGCTWPELPLQSRNICQTVYKQSRTDRADLLRYAGIFPGNHGVSESRWHARPHSLRLVRQRSR